MSAILCIETSTSVCSAAIGRGGRVDFFQEENQGHSHAEKLTNFISGVLEKSGLAMDDLDAVAVSSGPGSYTGLRIGVSTAKGICFALDKPLISVPSLEAMAYGASLQRAQFPHDGYFLCPMIDARRMEVYCALYDSRLKEQRPLSAEVVDADSFAGFLEQQKVYFFGDGAAKCRDVLGNHPHADFSLQLLPSARYLMMPAFEKFTAGKFENMALFEPNYLKAFRAGLPSKK